MTYTNEELADWFDRMVTAANDNPILGLAFGGIPDFGSTGPGALMADMVERFTQTAKRLRSMPTLDSLDVSPARTTDPETSKAAARGITADNARGKIALAYYRDAKLYGGSGLSAAAATRVAKLEHLAAPWKRASELKQAGIIAATGETIKGTRGQRQDVLAITDYGVSEVERVFPDAVNTLFDLGTPPPLTPSDPELAAEG